METPRPFIGGRDLEAMYHILMRGRKANNGSYYIHQGDLKWWLYYPPLEGGFWDQIYLWDDPKHPGQLLGWVLLSPHWVGFDVYFLPELRGSPLAQEMYIWAESEAISLAREKGKPTISVLWVLHDDDVLDGHLRQRGFRLRRGYVHLTRGLDDAITPSGLPDGFEVRGCKGEPEVVARACSQYGAFGSKAPFEFYRERFSNFMRSPVYDPELDIVVVAPDGQVGAFCIVWIDQLNQVGLFEPVGTHPDFQRKGLGRAVMKEGLRRMRERGMRTAIVSTFEDNAAAIKLYDSLGFRIVNHLGTYEKDV